MSKNTAKTETIARRGIESVDMTPQQLESKTTPCRTNERLRDISTEHDAGEGPRLRKMSEETEAVCPSGY